MLKNLMRPPDRLSPALRWRNHAGCSINSLELVVCKKVTRRANASVFSRGSRKLLRPTPTSRNLCLASRPTLSRR